MTPEERMRITGQESGERINVYKLNEIKMSGDDGTFSMREVLAEKGEDGKYPVKDLGDHVDAVIIKMRWRLTRYEELPDNKSIYYMTSEYDSKNTDKVVLFTNMEKDIAVKIKEKYGLGTQQVVYAYVPALKQVCRIIVKASGLGSEKNPNKELGLFDHKNSFTESNTFIDDFITHFSSVYREDEKNKRKSYYATVFSTGRELTDTEKEKIATLREEVHEKTSANKNFADEYTPPKEEKDEIDKGFEAAQEEVSPDDIPF